jgi:tetratricopeptide (TPR) repeat protein
LRCAEKLEHLGDIAAEAQQHDEAIYHYSTALSLNPVIPQDVFMKRSKVYLAKGLWEDAMNDANQARDFRLA